MVDFKVSAYTNFTQSPEYQSLGNLALTKQFSLSIWEGLLKSYRKGEFPLYLYGLDKPPLIVMLDTSAIGSPLTLQTQISVNEYRMMAVYPNINLSRTTANLDYKLQDFYNPLRIPLKALKSALGSLVRHIKAHQSLILGNRNIKGVGAPQGYESLLFKVYRQNREVSHNLANILHNIGFTTIGSINIHPMRACCGARFMWKVSSASRGLGIGHRLALFLPIWDKFCQGFTMYHGIISKQENSDMWSIWEKMRTKYNKNDSLIQLENLGSIWKNWRGTHDLRTVGVFLPYKTYEKLLIPIVEMSQEEMIVRGSEINEDLKKERRAGGYDDIIDEEDEYYETLSEVDHVTADW